MGLFLVYIVSAISASKLPLVYVSPFSTNWLSSCFLTGEITATRQLIFNENQPVVYLVVTATDHGSPEQKSAVVNVEIRVIDVNNNAPSFVHASYR